MGNTITFSGVLDTLPKLSVDVKNETLMTEETRFSWWGLVLFRFHHSLDKDAIEKLKFHCMIVEQKSSNEFFVIPRFQPVESTLTSKLDMEFPMSLSFHANSNMVYMSEEVSFCGKSWYYMKEGGSFFVMKNMLRLKSILGFEDCFMIVDIAERRYIKILSQEENNALIEQYHAISKENKLYCITRDLQLEMKNVCMNESCPQCSLSMKTCDFSMSHLEKYRRMCSAGHPSKKQRK